MSITFGEPRNPRLFCPQCFDELNTDGNHLSGDAQAWEAHGCEYHYPTDAKYKAPITWLSKLEAKLVELDKGRLMAHDFITKFDIKKAELEGEIAHEKTKKEGQPVETRKTWIGQDLDHLFIMIQDGERKAYEYGLFRYKPEVEAKEQLRARVESIARSLGEFIEKGSPIPPPPEKPVRPSTTEVIKDGKHP